MNNVWSPNVTLLRPVYPRGRERSSTQAVEQFHQRAHEPRAGEEEVRECPLGGQRPTTRRRNAKTRRPTGAPPTEPTWYEERTVARSAPFVERLAYTRSQAAEALGLSRSTFIRRVL